MANFFKTFLKGILYVITLPLLIVGLAIYFVISLFSFVILSIKGLILFFKGESIVGDMPEDIEAKKRLDLLMDPIGALQKAQQEQQQNTPIPVIQKEVVSEQPQAPVYVQLTQDETKKEEIIKKEQEILPEPPEETTVDILEPTEAPISEDEIPYKRESPQIKNIQEELKLDNDKIEEISIQESQKPFFEIQDDEIDYQDDYESGVTIEGFSDDK